MASGAFEGAGETRYRMVLNLETLVAKRLSEESEIVLVDAATIFCRTDEADEFEQLSLIGPQRERTKNGV